MRFRIRPATMLALAAAGVFAVAAPSAAAVSSGTGTVHRVTAGGRSTAVPGGTQVWLQRFGGPYISATASSVATNPSRTVVYVTGITTKTSGLRDEVTVAYNAATGRQLWKARYQGSGRHPRGGGTGVPAITVSPDGATVYVAGDLAHGTGSSDYLVLAYNAATGAQLWAADELFYAALAEHGVAVSPDSKTVYITGTQDRVGSAAYRSYVTFALSAATGDPVWETKTVFPPHVPHTLTSIAVSPDGSTVFIAGSSGTVAYDAATGAQLWLDAYKQAYRRYQLSLAVSPDSSTLYVTGGSDAPGSSSPHYWTAALSAGTGAQQWRATYAGPDGNAGSTAIAVSPDGSAVYVTGSAGQASGLNEYATIGYDAATGHQLWLASYATPKATDNAVGLAVSPDGSTVYATGTSAAGSGPSADYATVAYSAGTGAQLWTARYAVTGDQNDAAGVVASGGNAIVTGTSGPHGGPDDFATVAYQG
jgi:putative pyrroloquinoline-quinone binding quinoprotein